MIINCRSLRGKSAEFPPSVDYFSPDCVIGTESWLDNSFQIAEMFPPNYNIYRKDRNSKVGGVFIAVKSDYISSQVKTEDNCEIIWSRIYLNKNKSLFLCSYYRPPNNNYDSVSGLQNSMQQLTKDINNKFAILGGNFNLPVITWEDRTVKNNSNMCKSILDFMDDFSLEQLVNEPTRGNNTLEIMLYKQVIST